MPLAKAKPGQTVSTASLRTEDLLENMFQTLEELVLLSGDHLALPENSTDRERFAELLGECQDCLDGCGGIVPERYEDAEVLVNDTLMDVLQEFAPEGHTFGTHPGDGSDYGFYPYEDE